MWFTVTTRSAESIYMASHTKAMQNRMGPRASTIINAVQNDEL